jgi:hypothetical protein
MRLETGIARRIGCGNASWWLVLALLAGVQSAQAARILKVGNAQEYLITSNEGTWRVNDMVCAFDTSKEVACGIVAQKTSDKLGIKLTSVQGNLRAGQWVTLRKDSRTPASVEGGTSEAVLPKNPNNFFDVSLGLQAGFNYFYPVLHVQWALNDALSLGLMPVYFNCNLTDSSVSGFGGFVTLNYYYTHFPFRGFFVQGGVGFYSLSVNYVGGSEQMSPLATELSLQWRGKAYWGMPLDIGVGVGGQYLFPTNAPVSIGFSGILPMFTAYLGFSI